MAEGKDFDDFFREEYPRLVYSVMRLGASITEADDIAAEAMTTVYVRWHDVLNPAAYAWTSARHCYLARVRHRRHEVACDEAGLPEPWAYDELDLPERERAVLSLVERLPEAQRTVLRLVYAGMRTREIASELGMPEATVRSNLRHARARLRQLLADEDLL
ncbi:RNA polymerase sigma factor [Streptomyces sp. NPDC051815]|uniref:RNA polymerase sigma factor n=1 Tax=Streptomyces sp. NPDC051815 TaxID=3365674 RepID=UPI0037A17C02